AADDRPDVRVPALVRLAAEGDEHAAAALRTEIDTLAGSTDAAERKIAAQALGAPVALARSPLAALVLDADPEVRTAALAAVSAGDDGLVDAVLEALAEPAMIGPAAGAVGRLGDSVLPGLEEVLADATVPVPESTLRLVRAARPGTPERAAASLAPYVEHPDRELGLAVLGALTADGVDATSLAADTFDRVLRADAEHAGHCLAALAAVEPAPVLERAIRDELDLLRHRVLALLAVRYGPDAIRPAALGLAGEDDGRRALAVEILEVKLSRDEAALAVPVVRTDLPEAERLRMLQRSLAVRAGNRRLVMAEIAADADGRWRSAWLQTCADYEAARAS
ncbi:MAG TPA: hypothetical protein VN449_06760, partial [Gaiellaceae bacterium]|nr:hypothetical protein [Gaiellaceae bacterium]